MAKAYPPEWRLRVLAACDRGMTTRKVAGVFDVSESWVRRIKQVRREQGRTTPLPRGGVTVVKVDPERLRDLVEAHPDATAAEYHAMLNVDCSVSAVD
ncbi:MAG: helix-turn-helix domain-containing protein, partial [Planctomycetota bacterium]